MIQNIQAQILVAEAVARQEKVPESTGEEAEKNAEEESSIAVEPAPENHGTLILDATCCPADIRYPTDTGLLNQARELVEQMVDILYDSVREKLPQKPRTYRQKAQREYLAYAKKRSHTIRETRAVVRGNLQYIRRDIGYLERMIAMGAPLSLLGDERYRKLLVIQELCRQQWDMYLRKSYQIEERIVSIDQPHIRPIVRGKAGSPVEFGAKVMVGLVGGYAFLMKAQWNNPRVSKPREQAVVRSPWDPAFRATAGAKICDGEGI